MIAGLFIRNIKCYSNLNFIPLIDTHNDLFSIFIGANGVGKSTILEAIGYILNKIDSKKWEITIDQKRNDAFVCPLFLIKKNKIASKYIDKLELISKKFWELDASTRSTAAASDEFLTFKDNLKSAINSDDYFLIAIGKGVDDEIIMTSTYDERIFNSLRRHGTSKDDVKGVYQSIIDHYSYIYIPIGNKIKDILSIQAHEMQGLMDKSISDEITKIISKRELADHDERKSIIDLINEKLDTYTVGLNDSLLDGYSFKKNQRKVRPNEITNLIISEYFNIRPLTKDNKEISSLSSGQQRLALIDVATTLLSSSHEKSKEIIFALDEPEASLEASHCFTQFNRLVSISEKFSHQVILTTHWYGLLLRPSIGKLHYIEETDSKAPKVHSYPMKNLFDHTRTFPNSIEMKSYFDLMTSMLAILKNSDRNWLLCEGGDDASYLELYLEPLIDNIHILALNGCGNVKRIFEFLSVPFGDKKESKYIKGKVLCLVDTDTSSTIIINNYDAGKYNSKLRFDRLIFDRSKNKTGTISVANTNSENTEIEDILDAKIMYKSLENISSRQEELHKFMQLYKINSNSTYSDLTGKTMFTPIDIKGYEELEKFKIFLHSDELKSNICKEYQRVYKNQTEKFNLEWVEQIQAFFNEK